MTERVEILGVNVDAVTMAQAVERVIKLIGEKNPSIVAIAGDSRRRVEKYFKRGKLSCT